MTVEPDDSQSASTRQDDSPADSIDESRMTFGDHLEEFRKRLIYALLGMSVMFLVTLYYGSSIVVWLLTPLVAAQREAGLTPMTVAGITTGFTTYIFVSLAAALILSSPWVLYQLWQFIAAGLYPAERKVILFIAPLSGFMTVLAVCFLYYLMLPVGLFFFLSFTASYPSVPAEESNSLSQATSWVNRMVVQWSGVTLTQRDQPPALPPDAPPGDALPPVTPADPAATPAVQIPVLTADPAHPLPGQLWLKQPEGEVRLFWNNQTRTLALSSPSLITPLVQVGEYLKFVAFLALGVVLAFQTPVLMLVLGWTGLVSAAALARYRRHAVLVCFVVAAVLTPPDPVTMTLLALPMYLLFEFGLMLMRSVNKAGSVRLEQSPE